MTRCIILAAGRGSRLHPYTADCPKCLTELGGTSLIERQLTTVRLCGIEDIVIVTGYRADMLELGGTHQVHNAAWETTNMVESLFAAEDTFTNDIIVTYSDIVYEPRVLEALLGSEAPVSVIVDKAWRAYWEYRFDDPRSDAESLVIDDNGLISDIGNKVEDIDKIEAQYIGLMRFRGTGIQALRNARQSMYDAERAWKQKRPYKKAYMTDLLMEMILTGVSVTPVSVAAGWLEIDTVDDYKKTARMFNDGTIDQFYQPLETANR